MGGWLDRWAKRAAAVAPAVTPPSQTGSPPPAQPVARSRRDFLKKASIVGGAVWTVPVLQSVSAPAMAASGTVCSGGGGTCGVLVSGPGPCALCAAGQTCSVNGDCANNICTAGICGNPLGGACTTTADCASSSCGTSFKAPDTGTVCGGLGATCDSGLNTATSNPGCAIGSCGTNGGSANRCGGKGAWCDSPAPCMKTGNGACKNDNTCKKP